MEESAKNASVLDEHLQELRAQSGTGLLSLKIRPDREYFPHAREISELFKSLKPLQSRRIDRLSLGEHLRPDERLQGRLDRQIDVPAHGQFAGHGR